MQKAQSTATSGDSIVVTVARFGQDPVNVTVPKGSTVATVLSEAGVERSGREELFVAGEVADSNDILENGDILSIVTPKQAGAL